MTLPNHDKRQQLCVDCLLSVGIATIMTVFIEGSDLCLGSEYIQYRIGPALCVKISW